MKGSRRDEQQGGPKKWEAQFSESRNRATMFLWLIFADFSLLDSSANFLKPNAVPTTGQGMWAHDEVAL